MSFDKETLYRLLPAFYRVRDTEIGSNLIPGEEHDGPLKALLGLVTEQLAVLEENFEQLYDDQFIETCAEWVVPYIGDLVGARGIINFPGATFSERSEVANILRYRRRKGTVSIIEQLAQDVTGWNANVVEYFQLIATTQYMNHIRLSNVSAAGLRGWKEMEYVNTPFDKLPRTVDVRNIERKRGKYNIPDIGIFLWRLSSYSSKKTPAFRVDDRRYKFDSLGKDVQLYNHPDTASEADITHISEPINVPIPVGRMVLKKQFADYYGPQRSILIYVDDKEMIPSPASPPDLSGNITSCNLSDIKDGAGNVIGWANMPERKIAIDPVLGRIAFPSSEPIPTTVHVDYYYGFSDMMGGGEYGRTAGFSTELESIQIIKVSKNTGSIQAAIDTISATGGVVEITDNEYYIETLDLKIAAGKKIEIRAADEKRPVIVLNGDMEITGMENSEVYINGLLICGGSLRLPVTGSSGEINMLKSLSLEHCTLIPGISPAIGAVPLQSAQPRLLVAMSNVSVTIDKSIVGALRISEEASARIKDSIIDATDTQKTAYSGIDETMPGARLQVENSTIIGKVKTSIMDLASNTIFFAALKTSIIDEPPVMAVRLQEGCIRFCYVPPGSRLPRQYHCQPGKDETSPAGTRPVFTSLQYGNAAYCQLSQLCSNKIRSGADDSAEIGAFHNLYQPQREQNLRTRLNEYLRFGLEAGIFYAS